MHKEKVPEMEQKGFFLSRTQKEFLFWEFFLDVIFNNTLNVNLLEAFFNESGTFLCP